MAGCRSSRDPGHSTFDARRAASQIAARGGAERRALRHRTAERDPQAGIAGHRVVDLAPRRTAAARNVGWRGGGDVDRLSSSSSGGVARQGDIELILRLVGLRAARQRRPGRTERRGDLRLPVPCLEVRLEVTAGLGAVTPLGQVPGRLVLVCRRHVAQAKPRRFLPPGLGRELVSARRRAGAAAPMPSGKCE